MKIVVLIIALLAPAAAWAQTPYAGMKSRHIKALSDQQIGDLQAGRGMGLALAARLELNPEQRSKVEEMFSEMKAETTPIGGRLIEKEADLDRQFASRTITVESLESATAAIARTQGELRQAHLKYHLRAAAVLDQAQLARYAELRGYTSDGATQRHRHHQ
ncbi:hypothetical protein ACSHT2_31480 [Bradyrhizobium sp. PUT101]|uniref:hypothetical protein n=1 Tax=Bradyrhizobium sp. PUT101 TaxID=3447427 RepID=UPI003F84296E